MGLLPLLLGGEPGAAGGVGGALLLLGVLVGPDFDLRRCLRPDAGGRPGVCILVRLSPSGLRAGGSCWWLSMSRSLR
jgi:hypothetical protein